MLVARCLGSLRTSLMGLFPMANSPDSNTLNSYLQTGFSKYCWLGRPQLIPTDYIFKMRIWISLRVMIIKKMAENIDEILRFLVQSHFTKKNYAYNLQTKKISIFSALRFHHGPMWWVGYARSWGSAGEKRRI